MHTEAMDPTHRVLADVVGERRMQVSQWGPEQTHPHGTGHPHDRMIADYLRELVDDGYGRAAAGGPDGYDGKLGPTWREILLEEVGEAFAERDLLNLRAELLQVAGVAVAWIEDIDRQRAAGLAYVENGASVPEAGPIGLLPILGGAR
ncbi:MAG TPA: hypothetical protein VG674_31995 [Amycolatopsis sp.]|nr:hypothetical protein [Amycolatopsis sp.]